METATQELNVYPNHDTIIVEPKSEQSSFFDFDNWGSLKNNPTVPLPPKTPAKPKRKYKKI